MAGLAQPQAVVRPSSSITRATSSSMALLLAAMNHPFVERSEARVAVPAASVTSRLNDFDKLVRCNDRRCDCIDAYPAVAMVTIRALLQAAWYRYCWNTGPRSPRIR
jgi:hypothetical protein